MLLVIYTTEQCEMYSTPFSTTTIDIGFAMGLKIEFFSNSIPILFNIRYDI